MRDLETVLCHRHSCYQPRYPRFTLCPECQAESPQESIVVEAVVNYFSKLEFRELFIETEHSIQMGTDNRRPDIVLLDKTGNFVAIAECKQRGIVTYGHEQLKSYLCATDTQFGVFANSIESDNWKFYENLRRNRFRKISRSQFEAEVIADRPIESIREEKDRLIREVGQASIRYAQKVREVEFSCKKLDELKEEIWQANEQLTQFKEEIDSLRKESCNLKEEVIRNSQQAEVLRGLKLKSTRDSLTEENTLLTEKNNLYIERRAQLQHEIEKKKEQCEELAGKINTLKISRDELEKQIGSSHKEFRRVKQKYQVEIEKQDKIRQKYQEYKRAIEYYEKRDTDLDGRIKHKSALIRELESRLDELEEVFDQESIYGQIQKELKRLDDLESEITRKQQLARQDQERHAACERNKVETNQKIQQLLQVSQERESTLKQLRVVVDRLKTANPEQKGQIERCRVQLVQDLRERISICVQLTVEINSLKEAKPELETEIRKRTQQVLDEEKEMCPAYVQIQVEIDKLKTEKSKLEAEIGHRIFMLLPKKD